MAGNLKWKWATPSAGVVCHFCKGPGETAIQYCYSDPASGPGVLTLCGACHKGLKGLFVSG